MLLFMLVLLTGGAVSLKLFLIHALKIMNLFLSLPATTVPKLLLPTTGTSCTGRRVNKAQFILQITQGIENEASKLERCCWHFAQAQRLCCAMCIKNEARKLDHC